MKKLFTILAALVSIQVQWPVTGKNELSGYNNYNNDLLAKDKSIGMQIWHSLQGAEKGTAVY